MSTGQDWHHRDRSADMRLEFEAESGEVEAFQLRLSAIRLRVNVRRLSIAVSALRSP